MPRKGGCPPACLPVDAYLSELPPPSAPSMKSPVMAAMRNRGPPGPDSSRLSLKASAPIGMDRLGDAGGRSLCPRPRRLRARSAPADPGFRAARCGGVLGARGSLAQPVPGGGRWRRSAFSRSMPHAACNWRRSRPASPASCCGAGAPRSWRSSARNRSRRSRAGASLPSRIRAYPIKRQMPELGPVHRRLDLWRCRNAAAASWIMEFDHADQQRVTAFPVPVAAALADRSISPTPAAQPEAAALLRFG